MDIDDLLQELDDNQVPSGTRDIADLTQSWIAERSAPEILPFQTALLERLMERIRQQVLIKLWYLSFFFSFFFFFLFCGEVWKPTLQYF